jgi:hypothetical protein
VLREEPKGFVSKAKLDGVLSTHCRAVPSAGIA